MQTNSWIRCRGPLSDSAILARSVRSGLVESIHRGTVIALDATGEVAAEWGANSEPFYMRSAAKPFQATISQEAGAALTPTQLAIASASHDAEPVHVAIVLDMLHDVGLDESALLCPPASPGSARAARLVAAAEGGEPRRVFHNCSGKHAAMLRASMAQGWPLSYTDPEHPLQLLNLSTIAEVTGEEPGPVGIDGCGVPTYRTSVAGLARAFHRLGVEARFAEVVTSMARYPALTSGTSRPEAAIAIAVHSAAKGGAEGCIGISLLGQGALAAKAEDGWFPAAAIGAIEAMRVLGRLTDTGSRAVADFAAPAVLGGGEPVGALEPALGAS